MKTIKNSIVFAIALISLIALVGSAQAQNIDLTVDRIDVNRDVPYFRIPEDRGQGEVAYGPTDHPGYRTQCNNISANITELEGNATGPFHVNFSVNGGPEICQVNVTDGLNGGETRIVWCNCSWYPLVGIYTITVTADCKNNVTETNETNNTLSRQITAVQNGLKGNSWQDGRNISRLQCHGEDTIRLLYSVGDSATLSGYHSKWGTFMNYTGNWTANDLPIPAGATIEKARLYAYYNFDRTPAQNQTDYFTMYFNDVLVNPDNIYSDRKNPSGFGSSGAGGMFPMNSYNLKYGMLAYDVKSQFNAGVNNNAALSNAEPSDPSHVAMTGMLLVVVYEHSGEPNRRICINEGFDMLKSGNYYGRYTGVNSTEATAYANFTGEGINVNAIGKATLITITNHADGAGIEENTLSFNGVLLGHGAWSNMGGTEITNNETDVLSLIQANDNVAAFQSYDTGGYYGADGLEATNGFLILENATQCLGMCYENLDCSGAPTMTDVSCSDCMLGLFGNRSWNCSVGSNSSLWCPHPICFNNTANSVGLGRWGCANCSDGIDNDGDGKIDSPADDGCQCCCDNTETTESGEPCVPELPVIALFGIGLLTLAGYVHLGRRRRRA